MRIIRTISLANRRSFRLIPTLPKLKPYLFNGGYFHEVFTDDEYGSESNFAGTINYEGFHFLEFDRGISFISAQKQTSS